MQDRKAEILINSDYKIISKNEIREICENINCEYAFIYHDKDITANNVPKTPHWHIFLRFQNSRPFSTFANYFGITENNVNRVKKWSAALAYLTHKNDPEKYQYDYSEVTANFDFRTVSENKKQQRKEQIINDIEKGIIKMYNLYDNINAIEYNLYKNAINNAFEYVQKKSLLTNKQITVIYLFGNTGTYKTTYAQQFALKNNKAYYKSSSSNDPLQDYQGQEVLILDDLRGDSFTYSDFLKIIDPYNNQSSIKSRYYNKTFLGDTIIITSSQSPKNLYINKQDCLSQLYRRLSLILEFTESTITEYQYIPLIRDIQAIHSYNNHLGSIFPPPEKMNANTFINDLELITEYKQQTIF